MTRPDTVPEADYEKSADFGDIWRGALARSSLVRPLARIFAGVGTCLMYHRIGKDKEFTPNTESGFLPNQELVVTVSAFNEQMAFLARNYNCLSLPRAVEHLKSGCLPPRSVIVTFDDGYLDNLTLALPILKAHGVPATIYIATGLVEQTSRMWWYELEQVIGKQSELSFSWQKKKFAFSMVDAQEKSRAYHFLNPLLKKMKPSEQEDFMGALQNGLRAPFNYSSLVLRRQQLAKLAADPLITIGAHTHHHPVLSRLPGVALRHEIGRSRELLEAWLKHPIEHLAYPFGGNAQACKREFSAARELGFKSAVTTRLGHFHKFHGKHLLALPRVAIGNRDCMARFEWKLSGLYSLFRRPASRILV